MSDFESCRFRKIDLLERRDLLRGICAAELSDGAVRFQRFPPGCLAMYDAGAAPRVRARCTAGVRVAFRSDTRAVRLAVRYGAAVDWTKEYGFDLRLDGKPAGAFGPAHAEAGARWSGTLCRLAGQGGLPERQAREFVLWLPNLAELMIESLEVEEGARVEALPAAAKRWLFLGDSITQGFVTAHPSRCFAALASDALGMDLHNAAVGGAVAEPALAETALLRPDLVTVAYGTNDYGNSKPLEDAARRTRGLLAGLRSALPQSRIACLTPTPYVRLPGPNALGLRLSDYAAAIRREAEAVEGVAILDGGRILPDEPDWFMDGVHPNAAGHALYAKNLIAQLRAAGIA